MKKTWTLLGVVVATMSALAYPGEALSQSITIRQSNGNGMKQSIVIKGNKPCPPPVTKQKPVCVVPQQQQVQQVVVIPQYVYVAPPPTIVVYSSSGPWNIASPYYYVQGPYGPRYQYTPGFWP
ncbi:MAG: hypothetical protein WCV79_01890 [Candidatus Paceibacterota bacterium]|jgi:hypothetical protein